MANTLPSTLSSITTQTRNKVDQVSLITLQQVTAAPRVVMSSELPTTNFTSASIMIRLGRQTETAFTAGVNFRIEASAATSGDGYWFPITTFTSALGTNVGSEAVNGACAAGQKTINAASTTNLVVGNIIFINNTTLANSEFARITTVTLNTSIAVEDNLLFAQTGSTLYTQGEFYYALIDTTAIERLRIVVDGSGAAQNFVVDAYAVVGA